MCGKAARRAFRRSRNRLPEARRARLRRAALRAPGPGYGRDPAICCRKARILCELCIVYRAGLWYTELLAKGEQKPCASPG